MEDSSYISIELVHPLGDRTRYPFEKLRRRESIIFIVYYSRYYILITILENTGDFESVLYISSESKSPK